MLYRTYIILLTNIFLTGNGQQLDTRPDALSRNMLDQDPYNTLEGPMSNSLLPSQLDAGMMMDFSHLDPGVIPLPEIAQGGNNELQSLLDLNDLAALNSNNPEIVPSLFALSSKLHTSAGLSDQRNSPEPGMWNDQRVTNDRIEPRPIPKPSVDPLLIPLNINGNEERIPLNPNSPEDVWVETTNTILNTRNSPPLKRNSMDLSPNQQVRKELPNKNQEPENPQIEEARLLNNLANTGNTQRTRSQPISSGSFGLSPRNRNVAQLLNGLSRQSALPVPRNVLQADPQNKPVRGIVVQQPNEMLDHANVIDTQQRSENPETEKQIIREPGNVQNLFGTRGGGGVQLFNPQTMDGLGTMNSGNTGQTANNDQSNVDSNNADSLNLRFFPGIPGQSLTEAAFQDNFVSGIEALNNQNLGAFRTGLNEILRKRDRNLPLSDAEIELLINNVLSNVDQNNAAGISEQPAQATRPAVQENNQNIASGANTNIPTPLITGRQGSRGDVRNQQSGTNQRIPINQLNSATATNPSMTPRSNSLPQNGIVQNRNLRQNNGRNPQNPINRRQPGSPSNVNPRQLGVIQPSNVNQRQEGGRRLSNMNTRQTTGPQQSNANLRQNILRNNQIQSQSRRAVAGIQRTLQSNANSAVRANPNGSPPVRQIQNSPSLQNYLRRALNLLLPGMQQGSSAGQLVTNAGTNMSPSSRSGQTTGLNGNRLQPIMLPAQNASNIFRDGNVLNRLLQAIDLPKNLPQGQMVPIMVLPSGTRDNTSLPTNNIGRFVRVPASSFGPQIASIIAQQNENSRIPQPQNQNELSSMQQTGREQQRNNAPNPQSQSQLRNMLRVVLRSPFPRISLTTEQRRYLERALVSLLLRRQTQPQMRQMLQTGQQRQLPQTSRIGQQIPIQNQGQQMSIQNQGQQMSIPNQGQQMSIQNQGQQLPTQTRRQNTQNNPMMSTIARTAMSSNVF